MLTLKKAQEKTSEAIFASNEQRAAKIKIGYQSVNGRLIEVDFKTWILQDVRWSDGLSLPRRRRFYV